MTFKVDDVVTFQHEKWKEWQGGKGIVRSVQTWGSSGTPLYSVEITEVPPANTAIRPGHRTEFRSEWLKLWEAPSVKGNAVYGVSSSVDHPSHYGGEDNPYEVIKVAEAWGLDKDAYLFNVLKYIARAGKKGDTLEDLRKGHFYLGRKITNFIKEKAK